VLAFKERGGLEGAYLMPLGAALFDAPEFLLEGSAKQAQEALWLFGPRAMQRIAAHAPGPPPRSVSFPAGGFHVLRRPRLEVAIACGPNGQAGLGGHSHNDKLAFELRIEDTLVICDSGTFCYGNVAPLRNAFRATRAHATLSIDGEEQAPLPSGRLFALPDEARARVIEVSEDDTSARFTGEHRGYARLGVIHRRTFVAEDDGLLICDELSGRGRHRVDLRFPLATPNARGRALADAERLRLAPWLLRSGISATHFTAALEIGPDNAPIALLAVFARIAIDAQLTRSGYSPGYGELHPSGTAVFSGTGDCPIHLISIILPL
jgi:hypothetical protein